MHEVVWQKNCDRIFVRIQHGFRAADSMTQTEWLLLDNRFNREQTGRPAHFLEQLELALRLQVFLKVEVVDEVRYNSVLSGGRHDEESTGARLGSFRRDKFYARCIDYG
ncbi:hypothetical protein NJ76_19545 [Rhodococcus sp. IITR03]|nr:hypothetical protein NJ76_19545 [Rhodococcus sp. IITR03]